MQSLSKYNKGIKFLLCAVDFFSKYAWVIPIYDKKGFSIVDTFQKNLKELIENETKYGFTKEVNFTITHLKNG